jgi:DNA-binding NtrC family response regulator
VDDDADVLTAASLALSAEARVITASAPEAVGPLLADHRFDAALIDMNFARGDRSGQAGLDLLASTRAADPALAIVLMTTYGGVALAVETLKGGAADFVLKPWRNAALASALEKAASLTAQKRAEGFNLEILEKRAIVQALAAHGGNVSRAAKALGLARPTLYRRMAHYGL